MHTLEHAFHGCISFVGLQVLPVLEEKLGHAEQRSMVWHTLRAMPLRLLERVMPWLAGTRPRHPKS